MAKNNAKNTLTRFRKKRGRKPAVRPERVVEHADYVLKVVTSQEDRIAWDKLESAKTEAEAEAAFVRAQPFYRDVLKDRLTAILRWVREGKFPKYDLERKKRHLADSIAGDVLLSPRRSRDICYEERKRPASEKVGMILRREFYIECTCGYRGPADRGACARCGTTKPSPELLFEMTIEDTVAKPDPLKQRHVQKPRREDWQGPEVPGGSLE